MKKMSLMKKIGLTALASVIAASFVGCPAGPQEEKEYKVLFDPAAEGTYTIIDESDADSPVTLVKGTDYDIVDGNLVITPNGWGTVIVLNEEVEFSGSGSVKADLAVKEVGNAVTMGVNLMSSEAVEGYSGEIAVAPSTTLKEYEGTFGKKYTGTDWGNGGKKYKGKESVIRIQPYVQLGEADDYGPTTDVEFTIGKIYVEVPAADVEPKTEVTKVLYSQDVVTLTKAVNDSDEFLQWGAQIDFDDAAKSIAIPTDAEVTISFKREALSADYIQHYAQVYGVNEGNWDDWCVIYNWLDTYPVANAEEISLMGTKAETANDWMSVISAEKCVICQVVLGIKASETEFETSGKITDLTVTAVWEE